MTAWANRIVGYGVEAPDQLLANPKNWRIHPVRQQQALTGALDSVGWVQDVIVNRTTGYVVDGHLRVALAISKGEVDMPVAYVELDEHDEDIVLASLDPIGALAIPDPEALGRLLEADVSGALAGLLADAGSYEVATSDDSEPDDDPVAAGFVEGRWTVICPECGHEWEVWTGDPADVQAPDQVE